MAIRKETAAALKYFAKRFHYGVPLKRLMDKIVADWLEEKARALEEDLPNDD